ncbi:unnamed protein product [Arabidopsis lyrata]|uniref:Uncharacterized protein n=1 Tax=Arabidopsis lyrata subsp. lyrata TaxID=81972 RepID=D7LTL1_ARALL|nr:putative defensin-like protein 168 [Arabidopsis lyrata subsp. lyrata]EFH54040.1 hypothetical protein ARALYDRAFT_906435 [Arabidopsis lyrata subsp. lyrata]CAH8268200.1 unnamed protein product [Arabidopsis lyrata]|eukprot:XP_020873314.1 putative defensin-like protein 168 [Arabidopsis lyrata subsp. lyrata]
MKYVTLFTVSYIFVSIFVFTHIQDVEARKICRIAKEYTGNHCRDGNDCLSKSTIHYKAPNLPKPFECACHNYRDDTPSLNNDTPSLNNDTPSPNKTYIFHHCICSFYC